MIVALLLASSLVAFASPASWLDAPSPAPTWNVLGASVPVAPHEKPLYEMPHPCEFRQPATNEDRMVAKAGWRLIGPNEQYGRTQVVYGTANYDGMCRPVHFQGFAFFGGKFIGTLSPNLMTERSDAALNEYEGAAFYGESEFSIAYARYGDGDAECCPHAQTRITFRIVSGKLTIQESYTEKNPK